MRNFKKIPFIQSPEGAFNEAACQKLQQLIHWLPRYDVPKIAYYAKNRVFLKIPKVGQNSKFQKIP